MLARVYGAQVGWSWRFRRWIWCKSRAVGRSQIHRLLGRLTLQTDDHQLLDKSLRAFREVLARLPQDGEALAALQKIHRTRGEWKELEQVLRKQLGADGAATATESVCRWRSIWRKCSERHMENPRQAAALLEKCRPRRRSSICGFTVTCAVCNEELGDDRAAVSLKNARAAADGRSGGSDRASGEIARL